MIVDWLTQRGLRGTAAAVVADGLAVSRALLAAVGENVDVILTSGGTGISPTDGTPEATADIVDYQIPGSRRRDPAVRTATRADVGVVPGRVRRARRAR